MNTSNLFAKSLKKSFLFGIGLFISTFIFPPIGTAVFLAGIGAIVGVKSLIKAYKKYKSPPKSPALKEQSKNELKKELRELKKEHLNEIKELTKEHAKEYRQEAKEELTKKPIAENKIKRSEPKLSDFLKMKEPTVVQKHGTKIVEKTLRDKALVKSLQLILKRSNNKRTPGIGS